MTVPSITHLLKKDKLSTADLYSSVFKKRTSKWIFDNVRHTWINTNIEITYFLEEDRNDSDTPTDTNDSYSSTLTKKELEKIAKDNNEIWKWRPTWFNHSYS